MNDHQMLVCCFASRCRIFLCDRDVTVACEGRSVRLSREGSLSCQICYNTRPRFTRSLPKDRPVQMIFSRFLQHARDTEGLLQPGFPRDNCTMLSVVVVLILLDEELDSFHDTVTFWLMNLMLFNIPLENNTLFIDNNITIKCLGLDYMCVNVQVSYCKF